MAIRRSSVAIRRSSLASTCSFARMNWVSPFAWITKTPFGSARHPLPVYAMDLPMCCDMDETMPLCSGAVSGAVSASSPSDASARGAFFAAGLATGLATGLAAGAGTVSFAGPTPPRPVGASFSVDLGHVPVSWQGRMGLPSASGCVTCASGVVV